MKKNLLLLCSAGLMALSLTSCNIVSKDSDSEKNNETTSQEQEVSNTISQATSQQPTELKLEDALNFVNDATNATLTKLVALANGKLVGANVTANVTGKVDASISGISPEDVDYVPTNVSASANESIKASANLSLENILKPTPEITGTNFYFEMNQDVTSKQTIKGNTSEDNLNVLACAALNGNVITSKYVDSSTGNSSPTYTTTNVAPEDVAEIAEYVKQGLGVLQGNLPSFGGEDVTAEIQLGLTIGQNAAAFLTGSMTADEFVTMLDVTLAGGQMFVGEAAAYRGLVVAGLEIVRDVNPVNYLSFTKENSSLTTTFNYASWKDTLTSVYTAKVNLFADETLEKVILSTVQNVLFGVLPTELSLSFTVGLDDAGCFTSVSADVAAKGTLTKDVIMLLSSITTSMDDEEGNVIQFELPFESVSYDASSSASSTISFSDTEVEIGTIA